MGYFFEYVFKFGEERTYFVDMELILLWRDQIIGDQKNGDEIGVEYPVHLLRIGSQSILLILFQLRNKLLDFDAISLIFCGFDHFVDLRIIFL